MQNNLSRTVLVLLMAIALGTIGVNRPDARAQNPFGLPRTDREDAVFLTAPRPLLRLLTEGQRALEAGNYSEAIETLGALLAEGNSELPEDLRGQDFFIAPERRGVYRQSLKGRVRELLGQLPAEGRRLLELQFGVTARQELEEAVARHSRPMLESIVRRYPHTEAAYEAMLLLAEDNLQRGHPLAAAVLFTRLWDAEPARQKFGSQLAFAACKCWWQADAQQRAEEIYRQAVQAFPGSSWTIGGRRIELQESTPWSQIASYLVQAESNVRANRTAENWLVHGGDVSRSAVSDVSMPLPNVRWEKALHGSLPEQELLLQTEEREAQADRVVLPRLEPRAVGDVILAKTTDAEVLAIDLQTGLTRWAFYQYAAPARLTSLEDFNRFGERVDETEMLSRRVWADTAFGRFSADHERFYYVTEEESQNNALRGRLATYNRLQGISIEAEGKLLWQVGGPPEQNADDPLAGAYFLGPPLPYAGQLFAIVDINGETRLVVLDAATGRLLWTQQLVHPLYRQLQFDEQRRVQALSPTISDGIIICPTGAGAVVAVDLPTRRLLWGFAYDADYGGGGQVQFQRGTFLYGAHDFNPLAPSWLDAGVIVQDGLVALSPPESNIFFVLDALTGEVVLPPQRREDGRYLAELSEEQVIVVGDHRAFAIDLDSQALVWETGYPDRARLTGCGLVTPEGILVPVSDNRLLHIDRTDGRIIEQATVDRPLGNLVAHRGTLLSLSAARLAAFHTRKHLEAEVARRLAADADDIWALNQKAELAVADGKIDEAYQLLRRSLEIDPDSIDTRYLLVESLMRGLRSDFARYADKAAELKDIAIDGPQRFEFLQWLAVGNIRAREYRKAFEHLMALVDYRTSGVQAGSGPRNAKMEIEKGYSVDTDVWLATQLGRAYQHAAPEHRRQMDQLVAARLEHGASLVVPLRRKILQYFQWHPQAQRQVLQTAADLWEADDILGAEKMLVPMTQSEDPAIRQEALRLLGQWSSVDHTRLGLRGRIVPSIFGLGPRPDVPTETESAPEPEENAAPWPEGKVMEVSVVQDRTLFTTGAMIPVRLERFGRPELQLRLAGDALMVFNANGEDVGHIAFDRASGDNNDVFTRAVVRGGLALIETASEVVGMDLYRGLQRGQDGMLWRQSLMSPAAGPRTPFGLPNPTPINTSLGVQIYHRESHGRRIEVGPLTTSALIVKSGTSLMGLDPYSGRLLWRRDGFDDRIRMAHRDDELAVVQPSLGRVLILDARDGMSVREEKHAGYWEHWFSAGPWIVDYRERQSAAASGAAIQTGATLRATLRIWSPLEQEPPMVLDLERGARAAALEDRFLVVLEPSGRLHYIDLQRHERRVHETEVDPGLNDVLLHRFNDTLVVFSRATYDNRPPRLLNLDSISRDYQPVNGRVYALDINDGSLKWQRPAALFWMYFPKGQGTNSPFMLTFRIESTRSNLSYLSLALLDLRSGELAYSLRNVPIQRPSGCVMEVQPLSHTLAVSVGGRTLLLQATDQPTPPQPIAYFGQITAPDGSPPRFHSFDLFR